MTEVLLYYLASIAVAVALVVGTALFLKKKKIKPRMLFVFLGSIISVIYFVVMMVLFFSTFNANSDQYFYSNGYVICIGLVYVFLLSLVRALLVNKTMFANERNDNAFSFLWGFGATPAVFMAFYMLIYTVILLVKWTTLGAGEFDPVSGSFWFADNYRYNPIVYPLAGHLYIMLAFFAVGVLILANGWLYKVLNERKMPAWLACLYAGGFALLESLAFIVFPFADGAYWKFAVVSGLCAIVAVVMTLFLPKEKKPADYTKQFE